MLNLVWHVNIDVIMYYLGVNCMNSYFDEFGFDIEIELEDSKLRN